MKNIYALLLLCCLLSIQIVCAPLLGQMSIDPEKITIVRDQWGVPHIYADSDEEAAYGIAWAVAEDDFESMQHNLLAIRGRLGEVTGAEGAGFSVFSQMLGLEIVDERYAGAYSPKFQLVLESYAEGVNAYAAAHPDEILLKKLFPITPQDVVKGYMLGIAALTHVPDYVVRIMKGDIYKDEVKGSNSISISKNKTTDGKTYFVANSHQPLEGALSWYELHVETKEGWNMLGATFPGGLSPFIGTNGDIAWSHTVNYPDLTDVYKLEMHPKKKHMYKLDGEWLELEKHKVKFKVKLGFLKLPLSKKYYKSKHGLVLKSKDGYYALRYPANMEVRGCEQWYYMNKARNLEEFKQALKMQGLAGMNTVYADKDDNIFYHCNGLFPYRDSNYDWKKVLPGDDSKLIWEAGKFYSFDSTAYLENPSCGFLFNSNNTPFTATCEGQNIDPNSVDPTMGYSTNENNRSLRFLELMEQYDKLSYEDFKRVKFDLTYSKPLATPQLSNMEELLQMNPDKLGKKDAEALRLLQSWNREMHMDNEDGAALMVMFIQTILTKLRKEHRLVVGNTLSEEEFLAALRKARKHLKRHFGSIRVPLGKVQRHIRGDISLPMSGGPDVLAAMYCKPYKKGQLRTFAGESYIQMVRFSDKGIEIESINAFGASNKEDSPHYADQMERYTKQELKTMTLDKETIMKNAERVYHPMVKQP